MRIHHTQYMRGNQAREAREARVVAEGILAGEVGEEGN
jgi:hypothetical protein